MIVLTTVSLAVLMAVVIFESRNPSQLDSYRIRFGIIETDNLGTYDVIKETLTIPLFTQDTGFCFGYSIDPPDERSYLTHEIIYLPAPPRHIDFQMPIETTDGGRIIRTPDIVRQDHMIYPFCFSEGDPLGPWRLEIFINNELARRVRFRVVRA